MGSALAAAVNKPVSTLWQMKNGYALCTRDGLQSITAHINEQNESGIDGLRARLRIGFHRDVEITDADRSERSLVSQAFCSALPVAYTNIPSQVGSRSQGSCSKLRMKRRCCAEFSTSREVDQTECYSRQSAAEHSETMNAGSTTLSQGLWISSKTYHLRSGL